MSKIRRSKIVSTARVERKHSGSENAPTSKLVYPPGFYGASLRGIRIAPNKARLVINQIRGQSVDRAREILRYSSKRAAYYVDRVMISAIGNADALSEGRTDSADLCVAECYVDEGTRLKRVLAGDKGRARPILRRMCHITVVLGPRQAESKKEKGKKSSKGEAA